MPASGDRSASWRASYRRVRKDPFRGDRATNRRRLRALGAPGLDLGGRWVDLGAGDGNLVEALEELGVSEVVAVEYQVELLASAPRSARRIGASMLDVPLRSGSASVVVVMDALHHLEPARYAAALGEIRRVLRGDGELLLCEPAATRTRLVLTSVLMGPLGSITRFTRDKRSMVLAEESTLVPWLEQERDVASIVEPLGFRLRSARRGLLHSTWRFSVRS